MDKTVGCWLRRMGMCASMESWLTREVQQHKKKHDFKHQTWNLDQKLLVKHTLKWSTIGPEKNVRPTGQLVLSPIEHGESKPKKIWGIGRHLTETNQEKLWILTETRLSTHHCGQDITTPKHVAMIKVNPETISTSPVPCHSKGSGAWWLSAWFVLWWSRKSTSRGQPMPHNPPVLSSGTFFSKWRSSWENHRQIEDYRSIPVDRKNNQRMKQLEELVFTADCLHAQLSKTLQVCNHPNHLCPSSIKHQRIWVWAQSKIRWEPQSVIPCLVIESTCCLSRCFIPTKN